MTPQYITSRDNPWLKRLRVLAQDNTAYRAQQQMWLEGDHLCRAYLARGGRPLQAVFVEDAWDQADADLRNAVPQAVVLPVALMKTVSGLESAAPLGFVVALPAAPALAPQAPTVVLDRVQDAGNVGSILRSAAAFGFRQVLALRGTAALWSPKVLRASMGAHFGLQLHEGLLPEALNGLRLPLLATSSHQGLWLHEVQAQRALPWPCAWVLGHEGQGVGDDVAARASHWVRIAQPGGEESLNVAAAAAICLYATGSVQLARR
jgi:TrmH family RNA methyltransferase